MSRKQPNNGPPAGAVKPPPPPAPPKKQLAIPIDGIRNGLLGSLPMDADYMAGVQSRAKMLAKACTVKPYPSQPQQHEQQPPIQVELQLFTLPLTLKKQWFDMILSGEKKEEYRSINDYWARRLLYVRDEIEWQCWEEMLCDMRNPYLRHSGPKELLSFFGAQFKEWQAIRFVNGYGKSRPSFCIEIASLTIKRGLVEWGAVDGEYYFTFQLGKVMECGKA